jgi:hypothetical protein
MHIIDCALQIKRTKLDRGSITDVKVSVSSIESDGDRLESAVFAGSGDGAKHMVLMLMTEQGMEYQIPIALSTIHEELELAHYWTNAKTVQVTILPDGSPEPYAVTRRTLPLESFFSQTAAFELAKAAR